MFAEKQKENIKEVIFDKIMARDFPKLMKDVSFQIWETL